MNSPSAGQVLEYDGTNMCWSTLNSLANLQAGQAQMAGGSSGSITNFTFSFPKTFVGTPKVVVTVNADPASDVPETFVVSVRKVSATNCTVNIVRADSAAGWSQTLRVNWMAWE
jgi:hypothetical protein